MKLKRFDFDGLAKKYQFVLKFRFKFTCIELFCDFL